MRTRMVALSAENTEPLLLSDRGGSAYTASTTTCPLTKTKSGPGCGNRPTAPPVTSAPTASITSFRKVPSGKKKTLSHSMRVKVRRGATSPCAP